MIGKKRFGPCFRSKQSATIPSSRVVKPIRSAFIPDTGYPDRGDFLGFVADFRSALLLRAALKSFRHATSLPAAGAAAPALIPGIGWSDHWSFWQFGYRALMLTDTAPYRYPYYHTAEDTPDKLDYERLARAVTGITAVVDELAKS